MRNNRSSGRLPVEALSLPADMLKALKAHRFRAVQDILAFGISDVVLVCKMGGDAPGLIEDAINASPKGVAPFSQRTPFRTANSFEQKVEFSCSPEFLLLPVTDLSLSPRAIAVLRRLRLQTISDVLTYGLTNIASAPKAGQATCKNIEFAILDLMDGEMLNQQTRFPRILHCLLPAEPDKREALTTRFGFFTGKGMTLPEVGRALGMSVHRVGKVIVRQMPRMTSGRAGIALYFLRQRIEVVLIRNGYIAALEDIISYPFFRSCSRKHMSFMINLLCALFPADYRIFEDRFLTSLSPAEVRIRTRGLESAYKRLLQQMVAAEVKSAEGFSPSFQYILHCLQKSQDTKTASVERRGRVRRSSVSMRKDKGGSDKKTKNAIQTSVQSRGTR